MPQCYDGEISRVAPEPVGLPHLLASRQKVFYVIPPVTFAFLLVASSLITHRSLSPDKKLEVCLDRILSEPLFI